MKKTVIALVLLVGFNVASSTQAMPLKMDGNCQVIGVKEPNKNVYFGPTFCGAIELSYITVKGPLQLNETKITGTTRVSGPIKSEGSILEDVVLENNYSVETVNLQGNTQVNGNITFEGKKGTVYVEKGSTIKGKVVNGNVVDQ